MKKKLLCLLPALAMLAFLLLPCRTSNLYIRIYFHEIEGDTCTLYYSTDAVNVFCIEQHCTSDISQEDKSVEFCLDASLDGHITGFRLDFPNQEQILGVRSITVSSAGVVKRQYNPCDFFTEENIAYTNNIKSLDLATASGRVYFGTSPSESYVVLSDELCRQITDCYSHFLITKLGICIFLIACFFFYQKRIFGADQIQKTEVF